jgi:hypothetical protein
VKQRQKINKRLPDKTLRRNDQISAIARKGLDSEYSRSFFSGRQGTADRVFFAARH